MQSKANKRRALFAQALIGIDDYWTEIFPESPINDLAFSDILIRLWLHGEQGVRKTDFYSQLKYVSYATAVKYLRIAVAGGLAEEGSDSKDGRARVIRISRKAEKKLKNFMNHGVREFSKLNRV